MEVTAPFPLTSACVHASLASHEAEPPACDLERNRGRPRGCLMVHLNLLLILLTPIAHSKPTRAMIPIGVSTETGTPAGDCCISDHDKAGRSAIQSIRCCVVDTVWFEINHDIVLPKNLREGLFCEQWFEIDHNVVSAGHKRGMPDEHRDYTAIHDGYGLDRTQKIKSIIPYLSSIRTFSTSSIR